MPCQRRSWRRSSSSTRPKKPLLYIVSTPIGNLGDITHRAIEVLSSVALIVAEDTRHSRRLLQRYEIKTHMDSYHEHNEARQTPRLIERMLSGDSVALISDAGTPLLSDPGARLVNACIAQGITIVPVPGASALLAALVASGMATAPFTFYGFLPRKGKERKNLLAEIVASRHTSVLYESPYRVARTMQDIAAEGGAERQAVIARELTKKFEEYKRGSVAELANVEIKGEAVILIQGSEA